ncbi:Tat pathway signal sequence domain protein [Streptomyces sp. LE64]|uniref:Tat pathway signal sequence domain protein n=1 Tax=Streptomyces sp. LE64 TaxID=3448653 RepID=UPI00404260C3
MAGGAIAVAGTAAMVAVTLPGMAGADEGKADRPAQGQSQNGTPGASDGDTTANGARSSGDDGGGAQGSGSAEAPPPADVLPAPVEGEKGIGSDPLTDDELDRAQQLATGDDLQRSARDVAGKKGPEHLYTSLQEPDPNASAAQQGKRMAEVVFYDYGKEAAVTKTVDLTSGKVVDTVTRVGAQPPASAGELAEAARLLIAHPLGKDLKQDFRHATGKELTDPGQAELSGFVFSKQTTLKIPGVLKDCGKNRCVSVVFKVKDGPWFDTRKSVVDLSARTVGRLG